MMISRRFLFFIFFCVLCPALARAANLDFTVNTTENVVVTGTPRLTLTIGSATQYATYNAGGSTANALLFRYAVQARDFDADGVAVTSPVDLNGGTIRDSAGNNLTLTYTAPNTANVKVQTYTVSWTTDPITGANETAAAISIAKAPNGATYNYTITSSGGGGSVTGSGTVSANPQSVTGINVSTLPPGTLTASVTVTGGSGAGAARTATASAAFTGPMDTFAAPNAMFSVRRLRSAYTGALLRVRRSSDNTEQDIGYTIAGNLNASALTTFCGANSCFVRTWYDQSGNGRNLGHATQSFQPTIVNAGTITTINARPTVTFAVGNALNSAAHAETRSSMDAAHYFVASFSSALPGTYNDMIAFNSSNQTDTFWLDLGIHNGRVRANNRGTPALDTNQNYGSTDYRDNTLAVWSVISQSGSLAVNRNLTNLVSLSSAAQTPLANDGTVMYMMGWRRTFAGPLFAGTVSEWVYLNNSIYATPSQTALANNQKTYFNVP